MKSVVINALTPKHVLVLSIDLMGTPHGGGGLGTSVGKVIFGF